jgi:acyl-CoA synthetase (NDP forming)
MKTSLASLFAPRGIAIVGASDNSKKFGGLCLENLIKSGYQGHIVPINPTKDTVMGVKASPSVAAIDVPVDVVAVCVPKRFVPAILEECAAKSVSYLLVMSGGYGEQGAEGLVDEKALVARARELGVRIVGPNLLGLASTPERLQLNASRAMREVEARVGAISLVSQSGSAMGVLYNRGAREGVRFRHLIALGNQSDIEIAEVIRYYSEDPGTKVIIASIEGLKDPAAFLDAASRCHRDGKPLIVVKSGRTKDGARVAATHTGSMASDYSGFAAKCEEAGIILVQDEFSLMRLAALYEQYGSPPPVGGIALLSPSGGAIAQTADRISEKGVHLAVFGPETVKQLETIYVPGLTANPLDFANLYDNSFVDVGDGGAAIVSRDADVAAIIAVLGTAHNLDEMVTGMGKAVAGHKPIIFAVLPGNNGDKARIASAELGLLAVDSVEDSVDLIRLWMKPAPVVYAAAPRPADLQPVRIPAGSGGRTLGEFEAKRLLSSYGVPVPREFKALTPEEAVLHARTIGFPVVLKGFGSALIHKSEFGAVKLNLGDDRAVRDAWAAMIAALGDMLDGCVVSQMVKGEVEVIAGAFRSDEFGPMIMFGAGGILAELLEDVAVLPAPAHPDAIRAKLANLKIAKLLGGFRGRPACDVDALVDAIARLSIFVADFDGEIAELDVNPLIVAVAGHGVVAVDARIRVAEQKMKAA